MHAAGGRAALRPDPGHHGALMQRYARFRDIYARLQPVFKQ